MDAGEGSTGRHSPLAAGASRGVSQGAADDGDSEDLWRIRRECADAAAEGLSLRASGDGSDPLPAVGTEHLAARLCGSEGGLCGSAGAPFPAGSAGGGGAEYAHTGDAGTAEKGAFRAGLG